MKDGWYRNHELTAARRQALLESFCRRRAAQAWSCHGLATLDSNLPEFSQDYLAIYEERFREILVELIPCPDRGLEEQSYAIKEVISDDRRLVRFIFDPAQDVMAFVSSGPSLRSVVCFISAE